MALLFRTELSGGSSIEPYTVIVSLDENFKGQPVTLTQGTEIMRKTCPTTVPYEVEFKPMNDGVWTVTSTTKDGNVVSVDTEPLLEWRTYNVTLNIDLNFQEWLNRGRVEKTFTSLDDVLADEPTVRQLMTVHDSVDYLVTALSNITNIAKKILANDICAKWINLRDYAFDMLEANANIKAVMDSVNKYGYGELALIDGTWQPKGAVPVMTSNTAPYGEVIASSVFTNYDKFKVFDDIDSTYWASNNPSSSVGEYIGYKFVNPICVKKVKCRLYANALTFDVYGSNDNSKWDKLDSINTTTTSTDFNINNDKFYLYYKIQCVTEITNMIRIYTLQFYGRSLNVSVPTMTSNTAPWGEAIRGYVWNSLEAFKAFDKDTDTCWGGTEGAGSTGYIGYKYNKKIMLKCVYTDMMYMRYKIQYSDDGVNWVDLNNGENYGSSLGTRSKNFTIINDSVEAKYFRILKTESTTGKGSLGYEINFYGLDYSEREFEEGSTMKYIYDHGVEFETLTDIKSSGAAVTKKESSIQLMGNSISDYVTMYANKIDMTPYKLIRAKIADNFAGATNGLAYGNANNTPNVSGYKYIVTNDLPNNSYYDISAVNQEVYPAIFKGNNSAGWMEFSEWWLE